MSQTTMFQSEWEAEGRKRFGDDYHQWKFACPICGNVATVADFEQYKAKGATPNSATCECISRYTPERREAFGEGRQTKTKPCDYAGYGLFRLSPILVKTPESKEIHCFAFAEPTQ